MFLLRFFSLILLIQMIVAAIHADRSTIKEPNMQ